MESLFANTGAVIAAFASFDSWEISSALKTNGAWPVGLLIMLALATAILMLYRKVAFVDRHLERTVMVWTYLIISAVIFVEVFRRFFLNEQAPWSTTLPPFLFLIMTWFGCAYNIRLRTHLSFQEIRTNLPRTGQLITLCMDAFLWLGFCWVVVVTSTRVAANSASNFQIMLGTDNVQQWWFLITVPLAFTLMAARVLENLLDDIAKYRSGEPIITQAVIGGE